jgi:isocitrate dehydrogenase kinase/phosphatase
VDVETPAESIARIIHEGFYAFYAEFKRLTRECRQWFDARDWVAVTDLSHRRIDLYQQYVSRTLGVLRPITTEFPQDSLLWREAHKVYADLIFERIEFEVAETFFNAITRKIFRTVGVNREIEFLDSEFDALRGETLPGQFRRLRWGDDLDGLFEAVLAHPRPALRWRDLESDAQWLARRFVEVCRAESQAPRFDWVDVLKPLFFRAGEGYIVARICRDGRERPMLVAVQPTAAGSVVDGAMFDQGSMLQVFSSTHAYFFVDVHKPADLVRFLGSLMPQLTESELYIAIAHHRHGKTLIYRELIEHLKNSDDPFVMAPGIPGLVMTVFTTASYRNVFKVIRDRFDKPGATREGILRSYRDVFRGARVGRLADTQEFEHLAFDRTRFTPECLATLVEKAGSSVHIEGDRVTLSHLYIEEKMTPLNLHLVQAPAAEAERAIVDYGEAIKELAANDIFAGDLLWKNFGVTRHGRLVLYDYDEICGLRECKFRRVPKALSYEDELSDQAFYATSDTDVFPEEWAPFIVPREPRLREAFLYHHADLLTPEFWWRKQEEVLAGDIYIGLPYAPRYPGLHVPALHRSRPVARP